MTEFNNRKNEQSQVAKFINLNVLKGKIMQLQKQRYSENIQNYENSKIFLEYFEIFFDIFQK